MIIPHLVEEGRDTNTFPPWQLRKKEEKKALRPEDLGADGGGREPENLHKKFQDEINPALEGQTFTLEQMKAYAEWLRLGFQVSFPAGKKEEPHTYLLGTVRSGTGRNVGDQKHDLVNQSIQKQALSFTFEDLQGSWEKFLLGFMTQLKLHIPDGSALDTALH